MSEPVKFQNPPIAEVVCGVLFNTLSRFKTAHVGLFWERLRTDFPQIEDVAPINPLVESAQSGVSRVQIDVSEVPPLRRTWFLGSDRSTLIQMQQDRFLFNWKRTSDEVGCYPSYEVVISKFEKYFDLFRTFLVSEAIGDLVCRQFELTYVNIVGPDNGFDLRGPGYILSDHQRDASRPRFLPEPEIYSWSSSYPLPGDSGRLHVVAKSALKRSDREKVMRLEVIARGISSDTSDAGRRAWFDLAHEWITFGFVDSTVPELHKLWGRIS